MNYNNFNFNNQTNGFFRNFGNEFLNHVEGNHIDFATYTGPIYQPKGFWGWVAFVINPVEYQQNMHQAHNPDFSSHY